MLEMLHDLFESLLYAGFTNLAVVKVVLQVCEHKRKPFCMYRILSDRFKYKTRCKAAFTNRSLRSSQYKAK